ncbi:BTB And C-terminal Kelch [Nesidiocoris tenuis]|uniref:BTB And C-terminal Kelch n=1 Tax=Nesidiocoris tenuis TaxID=355587 RepID=A0ABN7A7Q9_9HEMI|nr:BTB And C-terminal Kelch [Nesidiocoris tenuis]
MDDWQNKVHSMSLRAKFAVDHKILTDCDFTFGNREKDSQVISCHKLILAMTSPVFHAMFFGGMRYDGDASIEITDIEPQVFRQMVQYIYLGQSGISSYKNACDLYHAGKKYILLHLERQCIEYLSEHLEKENAIQIYEFAQFHGEDELERNAVKVIQNQASYVLKDESFLHASESTLATLLDSDRLNISSECELLAAIERWALAQDIRENTTESSARKIAAPLIKKLRLLTISKHEFVNGVATSSLLSDSEKLSLLLRIIGADYPPMMNGLCEKRSKRKPCREIMNTILEFDEVTDALCDGSEWFTSVFTTNTPVVLLGIEINLQKRGEEGVYKENLMVKVGLAFKEDHFAEESLLRTVPYNSTAQVMLPYPPLLQPGVQYAVHVFLCSPGVYPLGNHTTLTCKHTNLELEFVSHASWEQCHPWNTTVLSSLIFTDVVETDDAKVNADE